MTINPTIIHYNSNEYPFVEVVSSMLNIKRLHKAHQLVAQTDMLVGKTDQATILHKLFYSRVEQMSWIYDEFARNVVAPFLKAQSALVVQQFPTFRVHFPGSVAVGEFHRDSDYQHQPKEVNFWLPLTAAYATNTIWIESEPDKGDYQPHDVNYGQLLAFSGSALRHGNKTNGTPDTRISFDFRAMCRSDYDPRHEGQSVTKGIKFVLGHYYHELRV